MVIIYSLSDFHGALLPQTNAPGISKIGAFLKRQKQLHPDTIIISAGDMFQGTYLSEMTQGGILIEVMNIIGFDAMAIGNHEFDWGADVIARFCNGNEADGEAAFPFLAANIVYKDSLLAPDWLVPYVILKKSNLNIGIIGIIGQNLKASILSSRVKEFEFTDELTAIKKYSRILRTVDNCQVVILLAHADTSAYNSVLLELDDETYLDAIINGHTHRNYAFELRNQKRSLPIINTGKSGSYLGKITLFLDKDKVIDAEAENLDTLVFQEEDIEIKQLINIYQTDIEKISEVLIYLDEKISRQKVLLWAVDTLKEVNKVDLGIINQGAIRSEAFPLGGSITKDLLFSIMPFADYVVLVSLEGRDLLRMVSASDIQFSSNFNLKTQTLNNGKIKLDEYYRIATIDFLFEKENYPFFLGKDIKRTIPFRSLLAEEIVKLAANKQIIGR